MIRMRLLVFLMCGCAVTTVEERPVRSADTVPANQRCQVDADCVLFNASCCPCPGSYTAVNRYGPGATGGLSCDPGRRMEISCESGCDMKRAVCSSAGACQVAPFDL